MKSKLCNVTDLSALYQVGFSHVTQAYHDHVESYLSTTKPPDDTELAVSSGLLGSPLLGTTTRVTADWCHAWSLLGQWAGWATFPVPATGNWPRHGHLRGSWMASKADNPTFTSGLDLRMSKGSANSKPSSRRSHYQGLTRRQNYQAMKLSQVYETRCSAWIWNSAKQRLPTRLAELAQFGWLPLAAALFGTVDWQPQWLHHNFLPVIGLRVHAKIPPSPLSDQQVVSLLGLWERRATVKVSLSQPCFDHFLGPVLGHDEAGLLAFSMSLFLMLALLRPSRRTRQNRSWQQSAASGC